MFRHYSLFLLISLHSLCSSQLYEPGCFDWPNIPFTTSNYVPDQLWIFPGEVAPDFSLKDVRGQPFNLYSLLETKPVFMQLGSYTCPQYRSRIEYTNQLYERFGEHVHFVVAYIIEAHPTEPDVSAYSGEVSEACYSIFGHRTTYEERLAAAREVVADHAAGTIYLVDSLQPDVPSELNNKVWCVYGPNSNGAYVIGQDKIITLGGKWYNATDVEFALEDLLAEDGIYPPGLGDDGFFDDNMEDGCAWAADEPTFGGPHPPVGAKHGDDAHSEDEDSSGSAALWLTVGITLGALMIFVAGYCLWRWRKRLGYDKIADDVKPTGHYVPMSGDVESGRLQH